MVWTKQPKRLNSLVWATTIREESASVTTDVALKGMRGTRRRSLWPSAMCAVVAGSGISAHLTFYRESNEQQAQREQGRKQRVNESHWSSQPVNVLDTRKRHIVLTEVTATH
jgi:hypothetical protein